MQSELTYASGFAERVKMTRGTYPGASSFLSGLATANFRNNRRDLRSKFTRNHFRRDLLILDGIVEQSRNHEIRIFSVTGLGNEAGNFEQVVDVRLLGRTFSSLVNMPARRSIGRLENGNPLFHRRRFLPRICCINS
jgi:hypothetical protein